MVALMQDLEPWFIYSRQSIKSELEEFGEIVFVIQGIVGLGFEINKHAQICRYFENNCVVGAYGLTFNQRSAYNYKAISYCKGYFIRKGKWKNLLIKNTEIAAVLKH